MLDSNQITSVGENDTSTTTTWRNQVPQDKGVKFANVHIRNYKQMVGDHPDCTYGPPISFDWDYEEMGTIPIDDYEASRGNYRPTARILHMSELRRAAILKQTVGATDREIQDAIYSVKQIQRQRLETLSRDFPLEDKRTLGQKIKIALSRLKKPVNYF